MNKYNTTLVHISDPHFGTENPKIADRLIEEIHEINPSVVIVSGDLTQRAFKKQFAKAKKFLDRINFPKVIIPGNHDIPLFNIFQRFINPYKNYKEYISAEQYPEFNSENISLVGVNSCSPFRSQSGRIKDYDIGYLREHFSKENPEKIRGVVIHHNIFPFEEIKGSSALVNADKFLAAMNKCGVDIIFAGHLHKSLAHTYNEAGIENNVLVLQAGTCISRRLREEDNTYLVVKTNKEEINVNFRIYNGSGYEVTNTRKFQRFIT